MKVPHISMQKMKLAELITSKEQVLRDLEAALRVDGYKDYNVVMAKVEELKTFFLFLQMFTSVMELD